MASMSQDAGPRTWWEGEQQCSQGRLLLLILERCSQALGTLNTTSQKLRGGVMRRGEACHGLGWVPKPLPGGLPGSAGSVGSFLGPQGSDKRSKVNLTPVTLFYMGR